MYYRINVSRDGRHLFATAPESVLTLEDARNLAFEFTTMLPDVEVSCTQVRTVSEPVTIFHNNREPTS